MNKTNQIPLFFIIGRPRSGTTLLRFLFESHPNVVIPPESPVILNLYKKYRKIHHWGEKEVLSLVNDLYRQRYFELWLINRQELTDKLLTRQGETSFDQLIRTLYLHYKSVFPKAEIHLIGDKNPGYALYIKRLHKLYPDAKFIYINRDYRDNYLSLTRVNFEVPVVPLVVFRWKFAYRQFLDLKEKHPDNFYYLRYEELAADPRTEFSKLCDYLEIKYNAGVFDFYKKKEEFEQLFEHDPSLAVIHKSLLNPIDKSRIGKWESGMTDKQIRAADHVAGKFAGKAGYERRYRKARFWLSIKFFPLLTYANLIYRIMILGERLPYKLRNCLLEILGIFVKGYWWLNRGRVRG